MLNSTQVETLIDITEDCLQKYESRVQKRLKAGKNVGPLKLGNLYEVVTGITNEKYYFAPELQEFKEIFDEVYVKGNIYKIKEEGFLDVKQRYPYFLYEKVSGK